jgi:hypothetical protein
MKGLFQNSAKPSLRFPDDQMWRRLVADLWREGDPIAESRGEEKRPGSGRALIERCSSPSAPPGTRGRAEGVVAAVIGSVVSQRRLAILVWP